MKRFTVLLLALALCLALCACDADAAFEDLLRRLDVSSFAQRGEEPQEPENKPDEPKQPAPETPKDALPDGVWPDEVPALSDYIEAISQEKTEDGFAGQYLVSETQLAAWQESLANAGFAPNPGGYGNGVWSVRIEKAEQAASSEADWRLTVLIGPEAPAWNETFAAFPVYNGDGAYVLSVGQRSEEGAEMELRAVGETQEGYQRYLKALRDAGFRLIDYVIYNKETDDAIYEVNTDGAWSGDGSVTLVYTIVEKE